MTLFNRSISAECAGDCGPYEVKYACWETRTHAGKVKRGGGGGRQCVTHTFFTS
jgi:hypothetical protein